MPQIWANRRPARPVQQRDCRTRRTGRGVVPGRQLTGRRTGRPVEAWLAPAYGHSSTMQMAHPRSGSDGGRQRRLLRRPSEVESPPRTQDSARRGNCRTALAVSRRDGPDLAGKTDPRGADPGSRAHACRNRDAAAHPAQWTRAAGAGPRTGQRHAGAWSARAAARGRRDHRHHGQRTGARIRRTPRQAGAFRRALPRCRARRPCVPAHRGPGRAPHRREFTDGGCPAEGRLARQHRIPAAGARWPLYLDPQVLAPRRSTFPG